MRKKDALTMEIAGGLGNQLFMFYAGLYFQERLNRAITFDISDFSRIEALHPGANIKTLGLLEGFRTTNRSAFPVHSFGRAVSRLKRMGRESSQTCIFVSEDVGYINSDLISTSVTRIRGYFQSWIYFTSLRDKPILNLTNLQNPSGWLLDKLETLRIKRVLAIHVRRGDYALSANRTNGILSRKFYENALEQSMDYDSIWVFTDSPKLIEKEFANLKLSVEVITPPSHADPVESLLLMSATQQIVISNSTFSWWSAMLAADSTSIIAPSKWFEFRDDPSRLIPDSWNRVTSDWVRQ